MRQNPHVRICGGPGTATTLVYPTSLRERHSPAETMRPQFWVGRGTSNRDTCTWFTLRMESNDIRVHGGGNDVTYTVRPDDTGNCKL